MSAHSYSSWQRCRPLWFRLPRMGRVIWILTSFIISPLRMHWCLIPEQLHALLIVRDLYTPLLPLVDALLKKGILAKNILLLDAGSTAPRCLATLEELEQRGCRWIQLSPIEQDFGPYSPWLSSRLHKEIQSWRYPYLVSDPDLHFPVKMPNDWLAQLFIILNRYRWVHKAALPLATHDITHPLRESVIAHERRLRRKFPYQLLSRLLLRKETGLSLCTTDTTMALYRPTRFFSTLSIRLSFRYRVLHLPWYESFVNTNEYEFYQNHKRPLFGDWSSLRASSSMTQSPS